MINTDTKSVQKWINIGGIRDLLFLNKYPKIRPIINT